MGHGSDVRKIVRERYGKSAVEGSGCCGPGEPDCCGGTTVESTGRIIGYSDEEMSSVPEGSNLGLGCGNPTAVASLIAGETVMDLGSGAGFDCFLAAEKVGPGGMVIGVDMTPEMLDRARENAVKGGRKNVEFRLGEIEHLPAADGSVDVIISNCVVNLSPDKEQVFSEAFRVLKPGGRLMVSDVVLLGEIPAALKDSVSAYIGCISGALMKDEYLAVIRKTGFQDVAVVDEKAFYPGDVTEDAFLSGIVKDSPMSMDDLLRAAARTVRSVSVSGIKPR